MLEGLINRCNKLIEEADQLIEYYKIINEKYDRLIKGIQEYTEALNKSGLSHFIFKEKNND